MLGPVSSHSRSGGDLQGLAFSEWSTSHQAPPLKVPTFHWSSKLETMPFTHGLLKTLTLSALVKILAICLLEKAGCLSFIKMCYPCADWTHLVIHLSIHIQYTSCHLLWQVDFAYFLWLLITRSIIFVAINFIFHRKKMTLRVRIRCWNCIFFCLRFCFYKPLQITFLWRIKAPLKIIINDSVSLSQDCGKSKGVNQKGSCSILSV